MSTFVDGFEQYAKAQGGRAGAFMRMNGYTTNGEPNIVAGQSLAGSDAPRKALSLQQASVSREFSWLSGDTLTVGVSVSFGARGDILRINTANGALTFFIDPNTGAPTIFGTAGYTIPVRGNWYFFQIIIERATNKVTLKVNGKTDVEVVAPFAFTGVDSVDVTLNPNTEDGAIRRYDDLYITSGVPFGSVAVFTRFPNNNTRQEWENSTAFDGGENLPNAVIASGGPQLDDLTYFLYSAVDGATESYQSADTITDRPVLHLSMSILARKTVPDQLGLNVFTDANVANISDVTQQYQYYSRDLPTAVGYNRDTIEGSIFGMTLVRG